VILPPNPFWVKIEVDPEGIAENGQDFWQDFIDHEPIVGIEAHGNA
jgi:hypothetical protein